MLQKPTTPISTPDKTHHPESVPGITVNSLRIVVNIRNCEAIASEAIPFWRRSASLVHDLEVDWDVPWQSLRVSFRIHEEPAIVVANLEVLAPQNADLWTQTHKPIPTNPVPQNRRSTSNHNPQPTTIGRAQSLAEHTHWQSTERKREERSGERKEKDRRERAWGE